jgi:hypothetical protein
MNKLLTLLAIVPYLTAYPVLAQNAIDLDGVDDQVVVANASGQIANATGFSMTCWVHPTQNANWPNMEAIAGFRDNTECDFYLLQTYGTTMEGRFRNSGNTVFTVDSIGLLSLNAWQHVALVHDGSTLTMYHNAVPVGSVPASGTITTTGGGFRIGNMPIPGSTQIFMDGRVDEVTLWRRGLTEQEIVCIMQYGADPADEDLRLYYRMDQGTADGNNPGLLTVTDLAGNQNGVLQGAALSGTSSNWVAGVPMAGTLTATICSGESYLLGDETLTEAGTYVRTLPTAGGCDSLLVVELSVTPVNVGVVQNNLTLIAQAPDPATWQWVDCDAGFALLSGATQQYFNATDNGDYAVIVQENGCADTSICLSVTTVGLDERSLEGTRMWFDMTAGGLELDLGPEVATADVEVYDPSGRRVAVTRLHRSGRHTWPLARLTAGTYVVVLRAGDGVARHPFVVP